MKNKMRQIRLSEGENSLKGKVVKDVSFLPVESNPNLIITFTDDTYIFIEADWYDDESHDMQLYNGSVLPIKCIDNGHPGEVINGKFHFWKFIQEQIRLGLIDGDEEYCKKLIEEEQKKQEEWEYERYLELKKKFEGK